MGKKCIPGVICIENMTLFFLFIVLILLVYFYYIHFVKGGRGQGQVSEGSRMVVMSSPNMLMPVSSRIGLTDPFNDPYYPPLQNADGVIYSRGLGQGPGLGPGPGLGVRGIPVNIETQGLATQYEQIGILENGSNLILPLMGRRSMVGRDKWQYYTISNTGTLNTKLPITFQGRSCTNENGCDNISSGDTVYVKGYNDTFRATVYESNLLQYIPY